MNWLKKNRFLIILILIIIINFSFWSFETINNPPEFGGDGIRYNDIALNLLNGQGFVYQGEPSDMAPVFPFFIALIYFVFGQNNYVVFRIFQIVLVILSILIIYNISKKIFDERSATVISLLLSIFYGFTISAQTFGREVLIMFFLCFLLYLLYQSISTRKAILFFASGVTLGLLALTNGANQLLFLFIAPTIYIIEIKYLPRKIVWSNIFIVFIGFLLIAGSWSITNKQISGSYSLEAREGIILLMRANYAETLYRDYPAHLIGYTFGYYFSEKLYPDVDVHAFRDRSELFEREKELRQEGFSKLEINSITFKEAIKKIVYMPHKYAAMMFLDFISFNSPFKPQKGEAWANMRIHVMFAEGRRPDLSDFEKSTIILTIRLIWLTFFLFVIYGLRWVIKSGRIASVILILSVIIYFNVIYASVHAIPRYAEPIYPLYILFFAVGALSFMKQFNKFDKVLTYILRLINPNIYEN